MKMRWPNQLKISKLVYFKVSIELDTKYYLSNAPLIIKPTMMISET